MNPRPRLTVATAGSDASGSDAPRDAEILSGLQAERLDALAAAFDRWHHGVRVLAQRLLSDAAAAEDVVQEVFAALPRAVRGFRGEVGLKTFVLAIAVKRARHHRRAALRRRVAMGKLSANDRPGPRDPEQDAYRRELGLRMTRALDDLPHDQRVAFVLCEVEEMSSAEAAAIAGAPEATMRTRLHHARRRLRDLLAAERAP